MERFLLDFILPFGTKSYKGYYSIFNLFFSEFFGIYSSAGQIQQKNSVDYTERNVAALLKSDIPSEGDKYIKKVLEDRLARQNPEAKQKRTKKARPEQLTN